MITGKDHRMMQFVVYKQRSKQMAITFERGRYTEDNRWVNEVVTIAEGATLKVWSGSIQVMSDVWEMTTYARYWDANAQMIKETPYVHKATVDATPEVLEQVKKFLLKNATDKALNDARNEAARIVKGSRVRVAKGRTDRGVEGTVVVEIMRPYGIGYRASMMRKLGIATSDVKVPYKAANGRTYDNYRDMVWVWAHNVELVETPEIDLHEVTRIAQDTAKWKFNDLYKAVA
jgi:hypothetical protein